MGQQLHREPWSVNESSPFLYSSLWRDGRKAEYFLDNKPGKPLDWKCCGGLEGNGVLVSGRTLC